MRKGTKAFLLVVASLVAAALLLSAGFMMGLDPHIGGAVRGLFPESTESTTSSTDMFGLEREVFEKLKASYYKEVDWNSLQSAAIDGMLAGLNDPYTVYMDPEEYAAFLEDASGAYSGVGMVVEMKNRLVTVVSTFKDSPAQLAGIRAGDVIISVDGVSTDGQYLDDVVRRIKGPEGTSVTLEIYRLSRTTTTEGPSADRSSVEEAAKESEGSTADSSFLPPGGEVTKYTLTRKKIQIPVTEEKTLQADGKTVALISLFTFSEGSAQALGAEIERAVREDKAQVVVLDLRSNGGGLLDEAVGVSSLFLPKGELVVSTEGLHSPRQVYRSTGGAFTETPLYVLTDEYTASASEIVCGALQDHKRAVLVGETTFGKGLVQSIERLSNGGAIKVTTAVYLTPNGRDINKTGITPDVYAPDDPATADVDETVDKVLDLISGSSGL